MAGLSDQQRLALGRYWPQIIGGAYRGATTQDLFNDIRTRASELGLSTVGVGANVISTLRGYAGRMIAAADRFNNAPDTAAMTAKLLAEAPWARSLSVQNASPMYHAIISHTIEVDDGSTITRTQTIVLPGTLPPTAGDLRSILQTEAELLAAEGGPADSGTPHGVSVSWDLNLLLAV